ncbi:hypothetical protein [Streptomyces sp. NBC_00239]|uniref:hypothetical protein n=1 Tax=Streptomyces sp. NBC_00239 TaxID=2903640 RepID=UPI002E29AF44|nr:hypothetical protein [Streptomyces sp. NBC_00239]
MPPTHRPSRPTRATDLARAEQVLTTLALQAPDGDTTRSILREHSWRSLLLRSALRTVATGGELHAAIHGRGWQARDSREAHYQQFFRTEARMLRLLKAAALVRRPYGPRGELRTRSQLLEQAHKIENASAAQGFFASETDEEAALGCVRIGLGLVHHLVSGAPLPANCSTGLDWQ